MFSNHPLEGLGILPVESKQSKSESIRSNTESISTEEACMFLECAEPKLQELLREGVVPALKFGKAWVIPRHAFFQAMNALAIQAAGERLKAAESERKSREDERREADADLVRRGRPRLPWNT
jgi:excisionase family DNA binding protein